MLGDKFLHELVDGTWRSEQHADRVQLQYVLLSQADIRWSSVSPSLDQTSRHLLIRLHPCACTSRNALVPCGELLSNYLCVSQWLQSFSVSVIYVTMMEMTVNGNT